MTRRPRFQGKDRDKIIADLKAGQSMAACAQAYNCSVGTVAKIAREVGLTKRKEDHLNKGDDIQ